MAFGHQNLGFYTRVVSSELTQKRMKKVFCCFHHSCYDLSDTPVADEIKRISSNGHFEKEISKEISKPSTYGLGWNDSFDHECRRLSKILDVTDEGPVLESSAKEKPSIQKLTKQPSFLRNLPKIQIDTEIMIDSAKTMGSVIYEQLSPMSSESRSFFDFQSKISTFNVTAMKSICRTKIIDKDSVTTRVRTT